MIYAAPGWPYYNQLSFHIITQSVAMYPDIRINTYRSVEYHLGFSHRKCMTLWFCHSFLTIMCIQMFLYFQWDESIGTLGCVWVTYLPLKHHKLVFVCTSLRNISKMYLVSFNFFPFYFILLLMPIISHHLISPWVTLFGTKFYLMPGGYVNWSCHPCSRTYFFRRKNTPCWAGCWCNWW